MRFTRSKNEKKFVNVKQAKCFMVTFFFGKILNNSKYSQTNNTKNPSKY